MTSRERRLASYARYRASEKGRARTHRYNTGPAGKATVARYRDTAKGIFTVFRCALNARMREHAGRLGALTAQLGAAQEAV